MLINKTYLKDHQYKNANNLADRRKLFQYGTNPESLWHWVAKQYFIAPSAKILEREIERLLHWRWLIAKKSPKRFKT